MTLAVMIVGKKMQNTMNNKSIIKELIWEFENGFYSPYELIAKLKELYE
jgi:predicted nucleic acid-binding protein